MALAIERGIGGLDSDPEQAIKWWERAAAQVTLCEQCHLRCLPPARLSHTNHRSRTKARWLQLVLQRCASAVLTTTGAMACAGLCAGQGGFGAPGCIWAVHADAVTSQRSAHWREASLSDIKVSIIKMRSVLGYTAVSFLTAHHELG